jgi:hypothetical protein
MSDRKEKIGNTINQLDLLHRLFITHGHYGGVIPRALGIRDDLLVVWRGMEECQSISWRIFGCTPLIKSRVAQV